MTLFISNYKLFPILRLVFFGHLQVFSAKNVAEMKMVDDGFEDKAKERKKQKLKMLAEKGLLNKRSKKRKRSKGLQHDGRKQQREEVEKLSDKGSKNKRSLQSS